ncbi:hypothetical protein ILUMI_19114 [Ignelater luminosus]|uniref:Integrase catalytic domain-containing protein n=1 Tax=Ignelater luminosus TaxID=2038154 RepID=A0A8K0CMA7_IGNLU|nr:hypothetical protein ILUMI_19114 [Ignelater luminosus]
MPVHKQSQPLLTINTHVGLFQYQRLVFGVAPGPSKFQEVMDRILIGLDGTNYGVEQETERDVVVKQVFACVRDGSPSPNIITKVTSLVAAYGLMEEVISDNGPEFCSQLIENCFEKNAIEQTLTPPYHANSNGAAKRAVQRDQEISTRSALFFSKPATRYR